MSRPPKPFVILFAEDDEGHAFLVQKNLERSGVSNQVVHVTDGRAALDFVRREGPYAERNRNEPLLLILDINMPKLDGIQVLAQLKSSSKTAMIPAIMLTTTDDPQEIDRCYQLGCSAYISKPVDYEAFAEAVKRLGMFLQIVQVPLELDE